VGKVAHGDVGISISDTEWLADTTHTIGGEASQNIVRTATYVVAASDAPAHVKAQADYLCDETADDVQIQAAVDALSTGRTWIETVKCTGGFSISAAIIPPAYTRLDLTEAELTLAAGANCHIINGAVDYISIVGGILDGNKANQTGGNVGLLTLFTTNYGEVKGTRIVDAYYAGFMMKGDHNQVTNLKVSGCKYMNIWLDNFNHGSLEGECWESEARGFYIATSYRNTFKINSHNNTSAGGTADVAQNNVFDLLISYNGDMGFAFGAGSGWNTIKGIFSHNKYNNLDLGDEALGHNTLVGVISNFCGVGDSDSTTYERAGICVANDGNLIVAPKCYANGDSGILLIDTNNIIVAPECFNNGVNPRSATEANGIHMINVVSDCFDNIISAPIAYDDWDTTATSNLTGNAAAAQKVVNVVNGALFAAGVPVTISDGTPLTESNCIETITSNALTMRNNLANTYTTAQSAKVTVRASQTAGVRETLGGAGGTIGYNTIENGNFRNQSGTPIITVGTNTKVRNNTGYITENSGKATLLNSNTTIAVAHGLSATPTVILITFAENPTNAIGDWWVDTVGATYFTFNGVDPGASNLDFMWEAKVR